MAGRQRKEPLKAKNNKKGDDSAKNTLIIVALIGAISTIVAALFSFPPFQRLFDTTPTSISVPTFVETAIPTGGVFPTLAQTPSSSLTPANIGGKLFEETFTNNRNGWFVDSENSSITAGTYKHTVSCPLETTESYCELYLEVPYTFPKNFRIDMDATVIETSTGSDIALGFQVRRKTKDHYYVKYFMTQGLYQLNIVFKGKTFRIIPDTPTTIIDKNLGAKNKLGIKVQDFLFTPIINDQELGGAEDGNLPNAGKTYLIISVSRGHSAIIEFDNLIVWEVR